MACVFFIIMYVIRWLLVIQILLNRGFQSNSYTSRQMNVRHHELVAHDGIFMVQMTIDVIQRHKRESFTVLFSFCLSLYLYFT